MTADTARGPLQSRSVRLHKDTLDKLAIEADIKRVGVTVLIRRIVENHFLDTTEHDNYGAWTVNSLL